LLDLGSTGDPELDSRRPFDEPYRIPHSTIQAIRNTQSLGGRIIAIGTTVARALEHAAGIDGFIRAGEGLATQRIGETTTLRVIDAILSGIRQPGTSHYDLLRAFIDAATLQHLDSELASHDYRTHEFGDSVFIEKQVEDDDVMMRSRLVKSPDIGLSVAGCRLLPL